MKLLVIALAVGSFSAQEMEPWSVQAQSPATPMTPSAPHEELAFFEGSWTTEERPAEQGFVETCAWLNAGRRHMICRSTWRVASGPREGVSIFSYRNADATYLYTAFALEERLSCIAAVVCPTAGNFSATKAPARPAFDRA
jgi:hypothetical protein